MCSELGFSGGDWVTGSYAGQGIDGQVDEWAAECAVGLVRRGGRSGVSPTPAPASSPSRLQGLSSSLSTLPSATLLLPWRQLAADWTLCQSKPLHESLGARHISHKTETKTQGFQTSAFQGMTHIVMHFFKIQFLLTLTMISFLNSRFPFLKGSVCHCVTMTVLSSGVP